MDLTVLKSSGQVGPGEPGGSYYSTFLRSCRGLEQQSQTGSSPSTGSKIPFLTDKTKPLGPLGPMSLVKKGPRTLLRAPGKILTSPQPAVTASPPSSPSGWRYSGLISSCLAPRPHQEPRTTRAPLIPGLCSSHGAVSYEVTPQTTTFQFRPLLICSPSHLLPHEQYIFALFSCLSPLLTEI